ncbi:MAG: YbeD family protein, partial [Endozoicomonas sp.]
MKEPTPPKIKFPCEYPIRIVGHAADDYKDFVVAVVANHDPSFDGHVKMKTSKN